MRWLDRGLEEGGKRGRMGDICTINNKKFIKMK